MFLAIEFSGSCAPFSASAVVLVALTVTGCSADVGRFDSNPSLSAVQNGQPGAGLMSFTGGIPRPRADLTAGGRSAEVISRDNSAARPPAPGNQPIPVAGLHHKPRTAFAKKNSGAVPKAAKPKPRSLTMITQRAPPQPAQMLAKPRSAVRRGTDATPIFDWPVNGKILARFGRQPNGETNDGISILIPEDTPIKSAEDGVVVYAGNGLKGFGNLVLVRHANNYVTVYAHAKELKVKRGDQIRRGQVIGASGRTGNVIAPQLYFEVRKRSAPVDPLRFLQAATQRNGWQYAGSG